MSAILNRLLPTLCRVIVFPGVLVQAACSGGATAAADGTSATGGAAGAGTGAAAGAGSAGAADPAAPSGGADADAMEDTAGGAAQEEEAGDVPDGLAGVVIVEDAVARCAPLCAEGTQPTDGDWTFERGYSCVAQGTVTGANQACTTGERLPEPESVPGVVVLFTEGNERRCVPLCVVNTEPADDPEGDDWSWENNASCIIPGTLTSTNQACMTLEDVPAPEPRPGIIIADDGDLECVPICRVVMTATDAGGDWGYEDNESCVLPQSESAAGRRDCTFAEFPPEYLPPPLTAAKVADGFYVADGRLYDAYGNDFVMRGVNNAHIWYDGFAEYKAWYALDNIADLGSNTVRVVWDTSGDASVLADILDRIVELEMVPMVELHDVTGYILAEPLIEAAAYYTEPDVLAVLQNFREYLLVNIANEWSGKDEVFIDTYKTVITSLREAGLAHTLVVDASNYGQSWQSLRDYGPDLLEFDPEHNLLFSIHMYDLYPEDADVTTALGGLVELGLPLIVGEFGHALRGTEVAWPQILASAAELDIGYLAWSWTGNDAETEHLDLAEDWEGPLTQWGEDIFNGTNGIGSTALPASVFE